MKKRKTIKGIKMKQTFAIIKPDITMKSTELHVLLHIVKAGFSIIKMEERMLSKEETEWLYREHKDKDFFGGQVEFMRSDSVILLLLESNHPNTPESFRKLMGPTDFRKAELHTLRARFATSHRHNAIHGSDGIDSAVAEIKYFFGDGERHH